MSKRVYLAMSVLIVLAAGIASGQSTADQKSKEKTERGNKEVRFATQPPFPLVINLGEGSYLGVFLEEVTAERMKELGIPEERGAIVMKVSQGSPAEKAGLRENDVIFSFNGRRVDSVRELQRLMAETPPGRDVSLEVVRGGNRQTLNATLTKRTANSLKIEQELAQSQDKLGEIEGLTRELENLERLRELGPLPDFGNFNLGEVRQFGFFRGGRLGVGVESLTDQLGEYFGVKEGKGVLVTHVREDGPAAKAGLKAGDVIIGIDGENIDNIPTLVNMIRSKEEGPVTVRILRDRNEQTVTVTLEKTERSPRGRMRIVPPRVRYRSI